MAKIVEYPPKEPPVTFRFECKCRCVFDWTSGEDEVYTNSKSRAISSNERVGWWVYCPICITMIWMTTEQADKLPFSAKMRAR